MTAPASPTPEHTFARPLRRVSLAILVMFSALFVSLSVIQVISADTLRDDPRNSRTFYANASVDRGPILVEGVPIADSIPVDGPIAYQRTYPNGPMYSAVTGYMTIGQGNTGLEAAMNGYLTGSTGGQFFDQINTVLTGRPAQGAAVETTLNAAAQQAAWDALTSQGLQGAVLAYKPDTGEILAMVSTPAFDPNELAVHDSEAVIGRYNELLEVPGDPLINSTIAGALNPPGSTFKLVVAAAALESGDYTADSAFPNPAVLPLPQSDNVVQNASKTTCGPGETTTLAYAVAMSCNIPLAELGEALGYQDIRDQAVAFGFDQSVEVPMISTPSVYPRVLDPAQTMLSAFGQSDVRASPVQMAMVAGAIANDGVMMTPNLVSSIIAPDQSTIVDFSPEVFGTPISSETAEALTAMMVASVESGAATGAQIEGVSVAGKTGTAENGPGDPYTLWFTGFAPAENPEVVVTVLVEESGVLTESNVIAAPIARAVLEAVLFP